MLIFEHAETTVASPKAIWAIWKDVENWNTWDHGLEYVRLRGDFKEGTKGVIKPQGHKELPFEITEAQPEKSFSDVTKLPLTRLIFRHWLELRDGKVHFTHRVEAYGGSSQESTKVTSSAWRGAHINGLRGM